MTGPTNSANETAVLSESFTAGGGLGEVSGMGGDVTPFGGSVDMLPFTGISTIPLALAGLVAVVVGAVSNRLGRAQTAAPTGD